MSKPLSPLRYPGGKSAITEHIARIVLGNGMRDCIFIEPFAGGASVGLHLLLNDMIRSLSLNDLDPGVWAFWESCLRHTDDLVSLIEHTEITLEEWHKQRAIQEAANVSDVVPLGFSTLFLNRCNYSGIIYASPIGGLNQDGTYKLSCRFNKSEIVERIREISKYKAKICVHNLDAIEVLDMHTRGCTEDFLRSNIFAFVDPPYYSVSKPLYRKGLNEFKHHELAQHLEGQRCVWIVSYDAHPHIEELYSSFSHVERMHLRYSAKTKRVQEELLIFQPHTWIPNLKEAA